MNQADRELRTAPFRVGEARRGRTGLLSGGRTGRVALRAFAKASTSTRNASHNKYSISRLRLRRSASALSSNNLCSSGGSRRVSRFGEGMAPLWCHTDVMSTTEFQQRHLCQKTKLLGSRMSRSGTSGFERAAEGATLSPTVTNWAALQPACVCPE